MKHKRQKQYSADPPSGEKLYESALRALARRARSSGEVRLLLQKKKATKAQIEEIIHRLREKAYLDDARFARHFAAARLEGDLHGKTRVRRDLAMRRVKPEIAQEAISQAYEEVNETELLRRHIQRKVRVTKPLSNPATIASLYRRLLRAGFRSDTIVRELKRMLQSPLLRGSADAEPPSWDELLDSLSELPETETEA